MRRKRGTTCGVLHPLPTVRNIFFFRPPFQNEGSTLKEEVRGWVSVFFFYQGKRNFCVLFALSMTPLKTRV
jgi:hypothetical protein